MPRTFQPPANLDDFRGSARSDELYAKWHRFIADQMTASPGDTPAFFDPLNAPVPDTPGQAAPNWTGLPRTVKRLKPDSVASAARLVEEAIPMGGKDPMSPPDGSFTGMFISEATGREFVGPRYRSQDEYLEWATRKDADGVINEVLFTCEGPEYWDTLATDHALLLDLYKSIVGDNAVTIQDLVFPEPVRWKNPNAGGSGFQRFAAGDYNPYNKWNILAAVHLTHPANTLGAEVNLGRSASRLFGNPDPVTSDPDLVCCGGYGGVNRMSDPTIGSAVNSAVSAGLRVSLRDPVGLYIRSIDVTGVTLADGTPIPEAATFFEPVRPRGGSEMIVRARFRVPDTFRAGGRKVRVGDLKIRGESVVTGGQLADLVTMNLFALTLPGRPAQPRQACFARPCPDRDLPEFIHPIPFSQSCPDEGFVPRLTLETLGARGGGPRGRAVR